MLGAIVSLLAIGGAALAETPEVLRPEQAFRYEATATADEIRVR
jgi:hypothetical protein